MVRTLYAIALAGALALVAAPASAAFITLPFVGDIEHPDLDPLHIMSPEPAAAAAPEKPAKKHHKMKKHMMKKKMMKKKM